MSLQFALDVVAKATIVLVVAWGIVRLVRPGHPALTHLVRTLALTAALALPLMVTVLPTRDLRVLPAPSVAAEVPPHTAPEATPTPPVRFVPAAQAVAAETPASHFDWLPWLVAAWAAGAIAVLSRMAKGFLILSRLRSVPFQSAELDLEDLAARAGLETIPELRLAAAPDVVTAMTWGVFSPVVRLPMDANRWSASRLEAVLLHEFAHVRRRDFLSGVLGELACALYWFHPIVWLSARAARMDAESAADDAVLRSGVKPSTYAAELLGIAAELGKRRPNPVPLGVSIMTHPKIESRLRSVLAPRALRRGLTQTQVLAAIALVALAVPALAGVRAVYQGRTEAEITESSRLIKNIGIATIMYSQDYDEVYPAANSSSVARKAVEPYTKFKWRDIPASAYEPFYYNTHLSIVPVVALTAPAETPLWFERISAASGPFVVAYADGHTAVRQAEDWPAFAKALAKKYPTKVKPRPLPPGVARRVGG